MGMPLERQQAVLQALNEGWLKVDENGVIWTNRYDGNKLGPWRQKATYRDKRGYLRVAFNLRGKHYDVKVHQVVWIAFNGLFDPEMELNHINGIKIDNRISNLELLTHDGNMKHATKLGLVAGAKTPLRGQAHPNAKLTWSAVEQIRELHSRQLPMSKIAKKFGVCIQTISNIVHERNWNATLTEAVNSGGVR